MDKMSTFQSYDRFAWQRSLATTMPKLLREVEDAAKKNFQMLALLEDAGRITLNHGGEGVVWPVMYRHHKAEGATGENTRNFSPTNLWKQAFIDWRGYEVTDSIKRREMEKNKGEPAIIKVVEGFTSRLRESLMQGLGPQFYGNGDLPENERFWHGFQTLSKTDGKTVHVLGQTAALAAGSTAIRTKNAADKTFAPAADTYAGLRCDLGYYGGEQPGSSPWPEEVSSSEYDFWSPIIVNTESTAFAGETPGAKLEKALRYGLTHAQRNSTQEEQTTNAWLDRSMFIDLKDTNDDRQTIEVTAGTSLLKLGFRNVMQFDGIEVSWEAAIPSGYGMAINLQSMELMGLTASLFEDEGGPEYDLGTQSLNAVVSTLSNLKYKSPRNACFFKKFATA